MMYIQRPCTAPCAANASSISVRACADARYLFPILHRCAEAITQLPNLFGKNCRHKPAWVEAQYCQLSCYESGHGARPAAAAT